MKIEFFLVKKTIFNFNVNLIRFFKKFCTTPSVDSMTNFFYDLINVFICCFSLSIFFLAFKKETTVNEKQLKKKYEKFYIAYLIIKRAKIKIIK